jgi:hypothetical protein
MFNIITYKKTPYSLINLISDIISFITLLLPTLTVLMYKK